ncbi:hypothetical protein THAOC_05340 [Thalassiosira oceanica]|uniref:Uncharacterized protein n=1 Tax=Thalassiosira oceanica TaxID=159749 RepID=K0T5U9_THAOC|nr:hypothetical protein THAOC_05340 [Thalassiosira oceanica]|eukprot:EJK73060.1 hypothetical protein THAOC_05340 [Thalassiosira oceanica]
MLTQLSCARSERRVAWARRQGPCPGSHEDQRSAAKSPSLSLWSQITYFNPNPESNSRPPASALLLI